MADAPDTATDPLPASTAAPEPERPARWKRRALYLGIGLVVLWLLAPFALSLGAVRGMIADKAGEALGRKVEIGSASGYWFRGIELQAITVHSPEGYDGPLATVPKIHADVDVLATLFGAPKAKVRVVQPHVTFRRNAAGASNADGVAEKLAGDDDKSKDTSSGGADIQLAVIGGRVESMTADGKTDAALGELDVGMTLHPSGDLALDVRAVAEGAGLDGASARFAVTADMRANGSTPFSIDVPGLDLARLAALIEDATGVQGVRGRIRVSGKGERSPAGTLSGQIAASGEGVRARMAKGVVFTVDRLTANATMKVVEDATDIDTTIALDGLQVEDPALGSNPYREPTITMAAQGLIHPAGWMRIAKAHIDAGRTAKVTMPKDFKLQVDPELRFDGQLAIEADLGRIGALRGLVPALEPLGGGRLNAQLRGTGDRGLDMGVGAAIANLSLRPSEAFPQGYVEPEVRFTLNVSRSEKDGTTLRLYSVASRLLGLTTRDAKEGVALGVDAQDRFWLDGGFDGRVDLASLSRLLASSLPLEPGERITGTLTLGGQGRGQGETMQLTTDVAMQQVVVPPSWSEARTPMDLRARVAMQRTRGRTSLQVTKLDGMGLGGELAIAMKEAAEGTALEDIEGQLGLDLGLARSWLAPVLGLEAGTTLTGMARSRLHLAGEGAGRRLDATVQITDLAYRGSPTAPLVREPRVSVRVNAWLAPEGGRHRAEELKITADAITLDASGSTYVASPDPDMDLSVRVGADAAKLAPTVASLLGEGYEDLRGQGRLGGTITATGSTANNARRLRVDGDLVLGSWTTGGLQVGDLKATVGRATNAEPLSVGLTSTLNRGRVFAQGALTLGRPALPWTAQVDMNDVDTSGVITSKGVGRLLAFALPALLPANANVPVLSGLLTARVEAEAPSIEDPAMLDGLTGRGIVTMKQGEIKNSTLFGGGGGGALGKVIQGLKVAVPEAGRILEGATEALTFSSLESKFRVDKRIVHVERAKLTGSALDVDMRGTVQFDKRVALSSKLILKGSAGSKVEKVLPEGAIPLRVRGTLAAPQVSPDIDMGKLLAGAIGNPADLLDDIKKKKLPKIKNPFK